MSRLSEILIKRRESAGFSQAEVASYIGKGLRTYQYYENGTVNPKPATLEKLSKTLNFSLSQLYDDAKKLHTIDGLPMSDFNEETAQYLTSRRTGKNRKLKNLTPVFNTKASAGQAILFNDRPELIIEYVDIPFIGKSDGVIEIVGDSMNPTYVNGTRIAVRKLEEKELVYPNECYYVIDINYDGRVKRLMKSEKKDHIILHSDNKEYPDVEFNWNKILAVCKILCRIIKN